jgi:hypothetical protein
VTAVVHTPRVLDASGVALVAIRVWCEPGSEHPFRGELRIADDVTYGFRRTQTFVDPDALTEAIRDFFESVECRSPN